MNPPEDRENTRIKGSRLQRLLNSFGPGAAESAPSTLPEPDRLFAGFLEWASTAPQRIALIHGDQCWSYAFLERASRQWARAIGTGNPKKDVPIGIIAGRGFYQIAAWLGVLRAGYGFLPLPPDRPGVRDEAERLRRAGGLLIGDETAARMSVPAADLLLWEQVPPLDEAAALEPDGTNPDPEHAAYALADEKSARGAYALVSHASALNTISSITSRFAVDDSDRLLMLAPMDDDLAIFDIFGILGTGGCLVIPPEDADTAALCGLMDITQPTVLNTTPPRLRRLADGCTARGRGLPRSLRLLLLSRSWLHADLVKRLHASSPRVQLVYLTGRPEAAIWSLVHPIPRNGPTTEGLILGHPLPNRQASILNHKLGSCPPWTVGRLYLAGRGLPAGFWHPQGLAPEPLPIHPQTGAALFPTDLRCRYRPGGEMEWLGVTAEEHEPGAMSPRDLENALLQHPALTDTVALAPPRPGLPVTLFIVPKWSVAPAKTELIRFLEDQLPGFALDLHLITVQAIPLTRFGLVDWENLAARAHGSTEIGEPTSQAGPAETPVQTPINATLVQEFARVLQKVTQLENIDPAANWFNLGASSVDLIRLANALDQSHGFRPDLDLLFRDPSLMGLVRQYGATQGDGPQLEKNQPDHQAGELPELILDPEAREAFKRAQHGIRSDLGQQRRVGLETPPNHGEDLYRKRRSWRRYLLKPVPLQALSYLLNALRQIRLNEQSKYRYASAGGLYPVQTYVYAKAGRVQDLDQGLYYYDPIAHDLVCLAAHCDLDRNLHAWVNRPQFDQSAFSLFLFGDMVAIEPMYGTWSRDFAMFEAGSMGQLLMTEAAAYQIGLCGIGSLDWEPIRPLFKLREKQILLHSFVGGLVEEGEPDAAQGHGKQQRIERLLDKMDQLSPEEIRALLKAKKSSQD